MLTIIFIFEENVTFNTQDIVVEENGILWEIYHSSALAPIYSVKQFYIYLIKLIENTEMPWIVCDNIWIFIFASSHVKKIVLGTTHTDRLATVKMLTV